MTPGDGAGGKERNDKKYLIRNISDNRVVILRLLEMVLRQMKMRDSKLRQGKQQNKYRK